jgi:uncharacterized protein (DUF433 family)
MTDTELRQRVTTDPHIFGGKPIVRGYRLAVEHVLGMLATGDTPDVIIKGYPGLTLDDIRACIAFNASHE